MELSVQQSGRMSHQSQRFLSPVLRLALLLGVAVHLAGFLIFRVVSTPLPTREDTAPFIEYVSAGSLASDVALEEQAQLFDSAPLFVPTRWNAAQQIPLVQLDRVRERFPEFEPEIDLLNALQPSSLAVAQSEAVSAPIDLLASKYWSFFKGFGESGSTLQPFPDIGHVAEVTVLGSTFASRSLSLDSGFDFADASLVSQPVVFYLRVSGSGMSVGAPTVVESSGNEAFDVAAREWLMRDQTLGLLPSGYLSVKVYP